MFLGLIKHWGDAGLENHIKTIQFHYKRQCSIMLDALEQSLGPLGPGKVTWTKPTGGMFIWLQFPTLKLSSEELFKILAASGVITVPGGDFLVQPLAPPSESGAATAVLPDPPIIRLTYAAASEQQIRDGVTRLASGILPLL
jgi:2-aminoadipate transaminase